MVVIPTPPVELDGGDWNLGFELMTWICGYLCNCFAILSIVLLMIIQRETRLSVLSETCPSLPVPWRGSKELNNE